MEACAYFLTTLPHVPFPFTDLLCLYLQNPVNPPSKSSKLEVVLQTLDSLENKIFTHHPTNYLLIMKGTWYVNPGEIWQTSFW